MIHKQSFVAAPNRPGERAEKATEQKACPRAGVEVGVGVRGMDTDTAVKRNLCMGNSLLSEQQEDFGPTEP